MKKILSVILLITTFLVFGQSSKDSVFYVKNNDFGIYGDIYKYGNRFRLSNLLLNQPKSNEYLFIYDIITSNEELNNFFVKAAYKDREVFFNVSKLDINSKEWEEPRSISYLNNFFNDIDSVYKNSIKEKAFLLSRAQVRIERMKVLEYFEKFESKKIGVIKARPYENYGFTGARFEIINFSKKTIKYITFKFHGLNAVDDKVYIGKNMLTVSTKGIGPVEYLNTGAWDFDDAWHTDLVERMVLKSMDIIYMDGTKATIIMNDDLYFDDEYIDKLNNLASSEY